MASDMIRCVHLKTGTDGRSHVEYFTLPMGTIQQATAIHFQESSAGSALDWHTAPHVQYVITLSGTL
jgi:quercetin dioxygenase-like cupin family protein